MDWHTQSPRGHIIFKTYLGHCQRPYGKKKNISFHKRPWIFWIILHPQHNALKQCLLTKAQPMPGMFAQLKEAHILLVQWKIIGAMKNKRKNRVTFSTKKTPCNINDRKVNNPCTICLRHGWCFSQTCPIQILNEIPDWLHSRHHKVSSKPVKLAFWLALGRCFVTSKKYDWNLIMPKHWTTLAMSSFSLSNGSYIFTNNGIWLFQLNASCGWKNYLLNVAQNIDPITLFLSTTISLCIATSVSSSSLPWTLQEVLGIPQ